MFEIFKWDSQGQTRLFVGQVSILYRSFWEIYRFYGGWNILHNYMNYMFIMGSWYRALDSIFCMGASNYKTIMPAMEQQDKSVLVQLLHYTPLDYLKITVEWGFKVINGTKRVKRKVHLLKEESHLLKEVPSQQPSLPEEIQTSSRNFKSPIFFKPGSSKVGIFFMRIDLRFPPCFKVSGVSAASAFAWLRTPRHRRSWGLPALQWWKIFEMSPNLGEFPEVLWKGYSFSYVAGILLRVFCFETCKRIWIDIPNLGDTPKSYPLKACNWGEKNLWALQ